MALHPKNLWIVVFHITASSGCRPLERSSCLAAASSYCNLIYVGGHLKRDAAVKGCQTIKPFYHPTLLIASGKNKLIYMYEGKERKNGCACMLRKGKISFSVTGKETSYHFDSFVSSKPSFIWLPFVALQPSMMQLISPLLEIAARNPFARGQKR